MCYKCHFRILNHVRSYIDSPDWIKNKVETIYSKITNKCFQYALTVVLNCKKQIINLNLFQK